MTERVIKTRANGMWAEPVAVEPRHEPERASLAVQTEMNALAQIVHGFESMTPDGRGRTLRYLLDRYGVTWPDAPPGLEPYRRPAAPRPSEHQ